MPLEYNHFSHLDPTNQLPNELDTDYRLEVVIASLIEQGYNPDQIRIFREGIARRGISKDIEQIRLKFSPEELTDQLEVRSNREGIYDMLPEGMFHKPVRKRANSEQEDALEEIRIHRKEEFFARRFFHPFEEAADRTLIQASLFETKYDRKVRNHEFASVFQPYWSILHLLDQRQSVLFMHIIPIFHKIRINFRKIAEALSHILDAPVKIEQVKLPAKQAERFFESRLSKHQMGVDLVLGNTFDDGEYDLKLTIGAISATYMRDFLETARSHRILEELCLLFLPQSKFIQKEFLIDPADSAFILSNETHDTYLGINSFI